MSAHTKGPWHVGPMSKTVRPEVTLPGTGGRNGGFIIAELHGADQADNARLIAAAPMLLEALQRALRDSGCDGDLCMHFWHDQARAAIAAATGETK